jgi:amino acid transporter
MFRSSTPGDNPESEGNPKLLLHNRIKRLLFGAPRDLADRRLFHNLSVIAFLAWVGLGADGLSSSCYGPEEAFRTLGEHTYLAVAIALAMVITVFTISVAYSRVIEHFPYGGGGYVVSTALLGEKAGAISGSALLVDYVLTITVSIAAAGDALFSFMPPGWHGLKLPAEIFLILFLTIINIRGVKESILMLLPVFLLFLATHVILIIGGVIAHLPQLPAVVGRVHGGFNAGITGLGFGGMLLLFIHAYSMGGGTYTGIEAVSNGLPIMREPRVNTGKRTMLYMAASLAFTASGLILCYLLWNVAPVEGKTMNAVLVEKFVGGAAFGQIFVILTLVTEGLLLVVAAQAGFIDGPRVLANMATDSWVPHRFSSLSERLTTRNGILLMGGAALAALFYTRGDIRHLVVMYSINVFLTFSMTELGMCRFWFGSRLRNADWKRKIPIHLLGFVMCATIFAVITTEKFGQGGWVTMLITALVVLLCLWIKRHYRTMSSKLRQFYAALTDIPSLPHALAGPIDPGQPTAAVLVAGYSDLGLHTALSVLRTFPGQFRNFVFISVGIIDSNAIKADDALKKLKNSTRLGLRKYTRQFKGWNISAIYRMTLETEAVSGLERLCLEVAKEFPRATFFAGQLVFQRERWYQSILHNQTAYALQKRLQLAGYTMVIIPAKAP